MVALAFVAPGSRQLILSPTFGEYIRAIQLIGGIPHEYRPTRPDLRLEVEAVAETIRELQPDGIWLCNPNNPTGQQWTAEELVYLQAADLERRAWWIIDASYCYFGMLTEPIPSPTTLDPQTILLRSLTKEHSLAGLRLGYAVAQPELIEILARVQAPWSVNSLAQVAGVAALQPDLLHWRGESLGRLHHHAAALWERLAELGYPVLPSSTPYTLIEVSDAATFRRKLLQQGILVRDCASFGLPGHIRIAAQLPEENERLVAAVADLSA
jgi:histidinol-phosphate/aromatic aminotransferase/cobyric acid decarboxylase-like protein